MLKSVGSKTKTLKTKALGPNTKTKTHYKNEETLRKRRPVLRKLHLERIQKNVVCLKVLELHKFASIHSWVICFAASLRSWRYCWRARSKVLAKYEILSAKPRGEMGRVFQSPPHSPRGFAAKTSYFAKTLLRALQQYRQLRRLFRSRNFETYQEKLQ